MNKTALVIIVLLFNISPTFPQESFISIMENLAVENKQIDAQLSGSDYVTGIKERKNFKMDKFPFCPYELEAIYVNTYNQYSVFIITYPELFREEPYSYFINGANFLLLYDEKSSSCHLIKYNTSSGQYWYQNQKNDSVILYASFHKDISAIIKLDSEFQPVFGATFYPSTREQYIPMKEMDICTKYVFCVHEDNLYYKVYPKQNFLEAKENLQDLTIEELDQALSDIDLNKVDKPWKKADLKILFNPANPFIRE